IPFTVRAGPAQLLLSRIRGEVIRINDGEKYARIYELAEKGMNSQEIAKKLNLSTDEVELALELKGRKLS
ncbi:MAG: hypothetical protein ACPLTR_12445, partial [Thermacetogeniaceae bacterium]